MYSDGWVFEGMFNNGVKYGKGRLYDPSAKIWKEVKYENGKIVQNN